ncbi:hypothetical protein [Pelagimonas varians]|uniref:Flagellar assembly protein T N-terminal domain-containing protein n=1 Tax=Pelagimonas varians TaxID=696760 RepID=A0A238JTB5_9RHOB|nr:hypothetical protein [Pelagimonas varians]PYG34521.1 hypothetical protein C8N36_101172 [Pelagimonas varians]SMX33723.1 hypothetical protein PEV8663_00294 [Pelagimonas varians]
MKPFIKALMTSFMALPLMLALSLTAAPVMAGEQPNLLIMGEDADQDTVPRNSRVFNRVLLALSNEMQQMGFAVYDETAVTMAVTNPARVRRTDAELLTVAKRVPNVPIDAVVVFQIYASAEQNVYAPGVIDLRIRVTGRMVHVQTGRAMGNFEVAYGPGELPPLPPGCNRDCVLEQVGGEARRIAADVGAVLAIKLDALSPARAQVPLQAPAPQAGMAPVTTAPMATTGCVGLTTAYTLAFSGFAPEEMTRIEEYLVVFKGYDHHRPVRVTMTSAEYWYETCSDTARLNRNLRLMAEQLGVQARISMVGNRFDVQKIGLGANR